MLKWELTAEVSLVTPETVEPVFPSVHPLLSVGTVLCHSGRVCHKTNDSKLWLAEIKHCWQEKRWNERTCACKCWVSTVLKEFQSERSVTPKRTWGFWTAECQHSSTAKLTPCDCCARSSDCGCNSTVTVCFLCVQVATVQHRQYLYAVHTVFLYMCMDLHGHFPGALPCSRPGLMCCCSPPVKIWAVCSQASTENIVWPISYSQHRISALTPWQTI